MKLSIIGMGRVGATLAFTLALRQRLPEIVLVGSEIEKAEADALDLRHAQLFSKTQSDIRAGTITDTSESDIVVVTASRPLPKQLKSRDEMAKLNFSLFEELIPPLAKYSPEAIFVIVTNPVDAMTYAALKLSAFPTERVFGTGTLIDSARFRALLSAEVGIHPFDLRAYILGEHGDTQVAFFSEASAGGEKMEVNERRKAMFKKSQESGYEVFRKKGYTNFAIAAAADYIIESIVSDANYTVPISLLVDGFLGITDVCISLPAVIGRGGIERILHPQLSPQEEQDLTASAEAVRKVIESLPITNAK